MNYGLLHYLKLARVDVVNVRKKGKNMKGIILEVFLLVDSQMKNVHKL